MVQRLESLAGLRQRQRGVVRCDQQVAGQNEGRQSVVYGVLIQAVDAEFLDVVVGKCVDGKVLDLQAAEARAKLIHPIARARVGVPDGRLLRAQTKARWFQQRRVALIGAFVVDAVAHKQVAAGGGVPVQASADGVVAVQDGRVAHIVLRPRLVGQRFKLADDRVRDGVHAHRGNHVVGEGYSGQRIVDDGRSRKIAGTQRCGRHGTGLGLSFIQPQAFVGREEEKALGMRNSAAGVPAKLVLPEFRLRAVVEVVAGVQLFVAKVIEQSAVEVLGAGAGHDVGHAAAGVSEIGRGGRGLQAKLLDRIDRRIDHHHASVGIGVQHAVEQKGVHGGAHAVHRGILRHVAARRLHAANHVAGESAQLPRDHAGTERGDPRNVALNERELLQLRLIHVESHGAGGRFHGRDHFADGDRVGLSGQFQTDIQVDRLAYFQFDAFHAVGREGRLRHLHTVVARRQTGQPECPVGRRFARNLQRRLQGFCRDTRLGYGQTGRIQHRAGDGRRRNLRGRGGCRQNEGGNGTKHQRAILSGNGIEFRHSKACSRVA